jgi:hypothetical protein
MWKMDCILHSTFSFSFSLFRYTYKREFIYASSLENWWFAVQPKTILEKLKWKEEKRNTKWKKSSNCIIFIRLSNTNHLIFQLKLNDVRKLKWFSFEVL